MARNEATYKLYRSITTNIYLSSMIVQRGGCVYIMTNKLHTVLYTGVTSDITARVYQHKNKVYPNSFTAKYNCNKLVYYLFYPHIEEAIAAEKSIKGGNRKNKVKLINELNPEWKDLYDDLIKD
ncbi:MAG: GIY-YIG nuclease family protein [Mucilaginibacter sp.]